MHPDFFFYPLLNFSFPIDVKKKTAYPKRIYSLSYIILLLYLKLQKSAD